MTENEKITQIKWLMEKHPVISKDKDFIEPLKDAIQALEEIQQYRAIGTVMEIKIKQGQLKRLSEGYLSDFTLLREYQSIGTIDEFKALKEMTVTQMDIDTFKAYIYDCMDDVAFGNTDWNHSLALVLKCMELHKT